MTATASIGSALVKTITRVGAMTLRFLFNVRRPRPDGVFLEGEVAQHILAAESVTPTLEASAGGALMLGADTEPEA